MKEEPEFKTYIEREGKVIEVFTLEESFNTAMENRISYHRWKLDGCVSVKDYSGAVYHENAIFIFQDSINIFNGLVAEKAKEKTYPPTNMTNEENQSLRSIIENHLSDLRKQFDACTDEEGLLEEEVELSARIDSMKWVLEMFNNTVDNIKKERESMKKHCEAYHMENFMSHTDGYFEKILQLIDK